MAADETTIGKIERKLDSIIAELRDVSTRLIRIEEKELNARIRSLEKENQELREWRVEMETKGAMVTAGLAALVAMLVSGISAAVGYFIK